MIYLYYFILVQNIGLISVPSGPVYTLSYLILIFISIPKYFKQRKKILVNNKYYKYLEISWLLFIFYFFIRLMNDITFSNIGVIMNIKELLPYTIFFPTIALISNREEINRFFKIGFILAIIGTILVIAQSIYGLEPLFDSPWYYTGAWPGNKEQYGNVARVNLPVSSWITLYFILYFSKLYHKVSLKLIVVISIFSVAIIITLFRSLWLSIIISFIINFFIFNKLYKNKYKKTYKIILSLFALSSLTFIVIKIVLPESDIFYYITERIKEGLYNVQTSTGTFGSRLLTISIGYDIIRKNSLFGVGYMFYYYGGMPYLVDVGFIYVGALLGFLGLFFIILIFFFTFLTSYFNLRKSVNNLNPYCIESALTSMIFTLTLFIYQHLLIPYSTPNIAIISAISFNLIITSKFNSINDIHKIK